MPLRLKSSASADADLWRQLDGLIRQHGAPPRVLKTKAHRSRRQAQADETDGIQHWLGNKAADAIAKGLARSRAEASPTAKHIEHNEAIYIRIIRCVAQGAAAAVDHWPDNAPKKMQRKGRGGAVDPRNEDDLDGDERHALRRCDNGRYECIVCKCIALSARGARRLAAAICPGAIMRSVHEPHALNRSHGVVWCKLCGSYSTRWARQLMASCPRKARSQAQRNVLRRLLNGLPPTTANYLRQAASNSGLLDTPLDAITEMTPSMTMQNAIGDACQTAQEPTSRNSDTNDGPSARGAAAAATDSIAERGPAKTHC